MYIHMRKHLSFRKLYDEEEAKQSKHHVGVDDSSRSLIVPVKVRPDADELNALMQLYFCKSTSIKCKIVNKYHFLV